MSIPEFAPVFNPSTGELRFTYMKTTVVMHPDDAACLLVDVRSDPVTPTPGAVFVNQQPVHDAMPPEDEWQEMADDHRSVQAEQAEKRAAAREAMRTIDTDATPDQIIDAAIDAALTVKGGPSASAPLPPGDERPAPAQRETRQG